MSAPEQEGMMADYLHRSGHLIERYRRAGKSIFGTRLSDGSLDPHYPPIVNQISAARRLAAEKIDPEGRHQKTVRWAINTFEMEGERDREMITQKIRVRSVFAFYHDPYEEIPAEPDYYILESNHPGLRRGMNVCAQQLLDAGVGLPWTPTFETWVKRGRKCYRPS